MIQCDEVFDILTRGPFPTGAASDGVVESHLTRCADCRRLAEALRPAIELFQEAVTPEESHGLPSYWGRSSAGAEEWSSGKASARAASLRSPRRERPFALSAASRPLARLAPWAAAVLVGIALAGHLPKNPTQSTVAASTMAALTKAQWRLEARPAEWLRKQALPAACTAPRLNGAGPSLPEKAVLSIPLGGSSGDAVSLACCKGCHLQLRPAGEGRRVAALLSACAACHQFGDSAIAECE